MQGTKEHLLMKDSWDLDLEYQYPNPLTPQGGALEYSTPAPRVSLRIQFPVLTVNSLHKIFGAAFPSPSPCPALLPMFPSPLKPASCTSAFVSGLVSMELKLRWSSPVHLWNLPFGGGCMGFFYITRTYMWIKENADYQY